MLYSGAWGKLIQEKNQKSKISWLCPFKPVFSVYNRMYLVEIVSFLYYLSASEIEGLPGHIHSCHGSPQVPTPLPGNNSKNIV